MELNGNNSMDDVYVNDRIHGSDKIMSFDIEDGSSNLSNVGVDGSDYKSSVSAADVLKTLFFVLMWYTFSTFLTL